MAVHGILSKKLETMIMARDLFPTLRLPGELSPIPSGACWGSPALGALLQGGGPALGLGEGKSEARAHGAGCLETGTRMVNQPDADCVGAKAAVLGETAQEAAGSGSTAHVGTRRKNGSKDPATGVFEERSEAGLAETEQEEQWGPKDTGLKQTADWEALGGG